MRRILHLTLLTAIACLLTVAPAHAQPFPSKTVRIVVPYSAGGSIDVLGRALAAGLTTLWSQPVVVENVTGAGSILGAERVASSAPDGYTLLLTLNPTVVGNRFLFKKLPYDPDKSLVPITMVAEGGMLMVVNPSVRANNFRELVEEARRAPGKFAYASVGVGSPQHLIFETIAKREGVQLLHVIYRGIAPIVPALVSGEVQVTVSTAAGIGGMVKAGKVKALAFGAASRSKLFPEVPTLAESGGSYAALPLWYGLFAPGGASAQITERVYRDVAATAKRPEFIEKYLNPHDLNLIASTPAEFAAQIRADVAVAADMVKAAGIKPE